MKLPEIGRNEAAKEDEGTDSEMFQKVSDIFAIQCLAAAEVCRKNQ